MLHDGREKKLKKDQNDVKKWTSKILLLEREIRGLREKRDETAAAEEERLAARRGGHGASNSNSRRAFTATLRVERACSTCVRECSRGG